MTGYESKRAAAHDKLDDDDALTIAYQSGFYDGKKAAQRTEQCNYPDCKCPTENPCLKGLAQPEQEHVAWLCKPDQHGLFDPPTPDKACKDCFPVYTTLPQRTWVGLMRGARVEGDTVVIKVQSNNEARLLCSELVNEMEKNT